MDNLEETGPEIVPSTETIAIDQPVKESSRIYTLDVLRGAALLAILTMNILVFALPDAVIFNPNAMDDLSGLNNSIWVISYAGFFQKAMGVFSMLFGAGVILFTTRVKEKGGNERKLFYRRIRWLLLFGAIHGYFLWHGDILFAYAVSGALLYLFRNFNPKTLIAIGLVVFTIGMFTQMGVGYGLGYMRTQAVVAQTALDSGEEIDMMQRSMLDSWNETRKGFEPTEENIKEIIDKYHEGYWSIFGKRFVETLSMQTFMLIIYLWRVMGLMLLGMALFKWGFITGEKSLKTYLFTGAFGYAIGIALSAIGINSMRANDFDIIINFLSDGNYDYIGGLFTIIGHISLIAILCKLDILGWLKKSLSAVGRMAFSNYIFHTIVFTTIFYGYGLGLYGQFERFELYYFVIGMWIFQMIASPIWLKHFRFGPLEWLWRSLTYRKKQPMRRVINNSL